MPDVYIKDYDGLDALIGRLLCGLPRYEGSFATLPPHFPDDNEVVHDFIKEQFEGGYLESNVIELLLASVRQHHAELSSLEVASISDILPNVELPEPILAVRSPLMEQCGVPSDVNHLQTSLSRSCSTTGTGHGAGPPIVPVADCRIWSPATWLKPDNWQTR
jgi:hypothetical protein